MWCTVKMYDLIETFPNVENLRDKKNMGILKAAYSQMIDSMFHT